MFNKSNTSHMHAIGDIFIDNKLLNFNFPLIFFVEILFNESDENNFCGYGSNSQISQIWDCKFHQKVMISSSQLTGI